MIGIDVSCCWDNCNFLLQTCPHSYVSKIFGIPRELHYFVVSSQTIETSYKSSSSSSSHTSKFGFRVNESPLLQMKKIIWSYIQIWMMYSSRCVLCPFHWEKNSNKLGMNDACVVFLDKVFEKEYAKVINFFFLHHAYNFLQTISYYSKIFTMIQTLTSCAQRLLVCKGFGFV